METVIRVVIFYLFVLFGLRVMGKREFSQLSPLELVTLLLIPELGSQSLVREDFSLTNGLVAIGTIFALVFVSSLLKYHSKKVSKVVNSSPTVLVSHGEFIPLHLDEQRIGPESIFAEMHKAGLAQLSQVKWAILETDGRIGLVPYNREEMVSPAKKEEKQVT